MIDDLMEQRFAIMNITEDYLENDGSFDEMIEKYNDITYKADLNEDYQECIAKSTGRVAVLSDMLAMKKLENNREDLYKIIKLLEDEVFTLYKICEEVK